MPESRVAVRPCAPVSTLLAACGLALATANAALGQSEPFPAVLDLADLDGVIGFRLDGAFSGEDFGASVALGGDVNHDGVSDLIVGAPSAGAWPLLDSGRAYVVFGRDTDVSGRFPPTLRTALLDGSDGFRLQGVARDDRSGWSVAMAGDINGDGIQDFVIGTYSADPSGRADAGSTYVLFGRDTSLGAGFDAVMSLEDLDGSNGFRLDGGRARITSGVCVSKAGDVNGDGIDDLIIGAFRETAAQHSDGASYIVFGRDAGAGAAFPATLNLDDLDGTTGFRLIGTMYGDRSGRAVACAGDINGDGIDDVVIGASGGYLSGYRSVPTHVVFGRDAASGVRFPATLPLADLDGTNGFRIDDIPAWGDGIIIAVASAGDMNGDGVGDVVVGAANAQSLAGATFVIFGRDTSAGPAFAAALSVNALDGNNGFRIDGADVLDQSGHSVASAGDLDGDGVDDLVIGAPRARRDGGSSAGSSFVIFGRDAGAGREFPPVLPLADLDGRAGFRIDGTGDERSGTSVASAGDINSDGLDDLAIGAPRRAPAGSAYVVYGRRPCAADLDADGTLTIFDFLEFGNLFDAMDPRADFDGDGDFTIFDFLAFQNAFDAGCP